MLISLGAMTVSHRWEYTNSLFLLVHGGEMVTSQGRNQAWIRKINIAIKDRWTTRDFGCGPWRKAITANETSGYDAEPKWNDVSYTSNHM